LKWPRRSPASTISDALYQVADFRISAAPVEELAESGYPRTKMPRQSEGGLVSFRGVIVDWLDAPLQAAAWSRLAQATVEWHCAVEHGLLAQLARLRTASSRTTTAAAGWPARSAAFGGGNAWTALLKK